MRPLKTLAALTLIAASVSGINPAQASGYLAIEGSSVSVENNLEDELNPLGLRLRLGMRISEIFDIEGHAGFTSDRDSNTYDEFATSYVGAYLKGYLPVGQRSALFALAGVSAVELTQTINGGEFSDDRTGLSWGVGLETQVSERVDLTADWMRYLSEDGLFEDISAVSFGLKLYF